MQRLGSTGLESFMITPESDFFSTESPNGPKAQRRFRLERRNVLVTND